MSEREQEAWGGYCIDGSPYPFIHENTVSCYQEGVRKYLGQAWAMDGEDWKQGWRRAYRKGGWRVRRVIVKLAEQ